MKGLLSDVFANENPLEAECTEPPIQSTGSPQTDAGVGIGMEIRGKLMFNREGN